MAARKLRGVALAVKNHESKLLIIQELQSNPQTGKSAGMFSLPMETIEEGESQVSALARLIQEELPGLGTKIKLCPVTVGVYRVLPRAWAYLYTGSMSDSSLPVADAAGEVGRHAWMMPEEALKLCLRPGAREMICDYILGAVGVVRICEPVQPQMINKGACTA